MTDVLNGLGSTPILRSTANWATSPKYNFLNSMKILQFEGTVQDFFENDSRMPQTFQAEFTPITRQEEYNILNFFKSRKGMIERFWLPIYPEFFTLHSDVSAISTQITIEKNLFSWSGERVFIETLLGDLWTAKVTDEVQDVNTTDLILASAAGREILVADVNTFGILLLCRFDKDTLSFSYETDTVSKVSVDVKEVLEYGEV